MIGDAAEKLVCPEPSTHPKLGRKGIIKNNNLPKYVKKSIFREGIKNKDYTIEHKIQNIQTNIKKYQDNSSQTNISCFKNKVDEKEKYKNYKLYFSDRKVSNFEPNFMKETENKRYRKYLNEGNMVEHMDHGNETDEMMKFWNPKIYPFTKTKKNKKN